MLVDDVTGHGQIADIGIRLTGGHRLQGLLIRIEQQLPRCRDTPWSAAPAGEASRDREGLFGQAADIQDQVMCSRVKMT